MFCVIDPAIELSNFVIKKVSKYGAEQFLEGTKLGILSK